MKNEVVGLREKPTLGKVRVRLVLERGRGSMKIKTSRVLVDVDAGDSGELPLIIKQSFKDDHYSPSTSMEERE
jgi:hypothetical protein